MPAKKPGRTAEALLEAALRPLLANSKITADERDRTCLVPEALPSDLLNLVHCNVSTHNKWGKAIKATGLSNAAVVARATPEELAPVLDIEPDYIDKMRRYSLKTVEQRRIWDETARRRNAERAAQKAKDILDRALRVLLKRSSLPPDERDQACLVPKVSTEQLVWLAARKLDGDDASAQARKKAGLRNYTALARATPAEIQAVPGMDDPAQIRQAILDTLAELQAGDGDTETTTG